MEEFAQSIITFIEQNQDWFPFIMVLFAAAETTTFLSLLIPSTPVLAAVGALAATGAKRVVPTAKPSFSQRPDCFRAG